MRSRNGWHAGAALGALGPLAACAILATASPASAEGCADAYESAQRQRSAGKYLLSRAELLTCQNRCPETLVADCDRWRAEVDALIPRLQVTATDENKQPTTSVRVTESGQLLATRIGDPIELDPGEHVLMFELPGHDPVNRTVSLHTGQTTHNVAITFNAKKAPPTPGIPSEAIVLGTLGLAGLAAGGALGIVGHVKRLDLIDSCKPNCQESDVDNIRLLWVAAGVSAGVGAAMFGSALLVWQLQSQPDVAISVKPTMYSQTLELDFRF